LFAFFFTLRSVACTRGLSGDFKGRQPLAWLSCSIFLPQVTAHLALGPVELAVNRQKIDRLLKR